MSNNNGGKPVYGQQLRRLENRLRSIETTLREGLGPLEPLERTMALAFRSQVERGMTIEEAYNNGRSDALRENMGWIVDMKCYLDRIFEDGPAGNEGLEDFRRSFDSIFGWKIRKVETDSVGGIFDESVMECTSTEPVDDPSIAGRVCSTLDDGYYTCEGIVVRKERVRLYALVLKEVE